MLIELVVLKLREKRKELVLKWRDESVLVKAVCHKGSKQKRIIREVCVCVSCKQTNVVGLSRRTMTDNVSYIKEEVE